MVLGGFKSFRVLVLTETLALSHLVVLNGTGINYIKIYNFSYVRLISVSGEERNSTGKPFLEETATIFHLDGEHSTDY